MCFVPQRQKIELAKPHSHLARLFVSVDGKCELRLFGIVVLSRGRSGKETHAGARNVVSTTFSVATVEREF
jgi:hypothetical protein